LNKLISLIIQYRNAVPKKVDDIVQNEIDAIFNDTSGQSVLEVIGQISGEEVKEKVLEKLVKSESNKKNKTN
jgi:hypothetical protein